MNNFYKFAEFPGIICCVDGTLIRIQAPIYKSMGMSTEKDIHWTFSWCAMQSAKWLTEL